MLIPANMSVNRWLLTTFNTINMGFQQIFYGILGWLTGGTLKKNSFVHNRINYCIPFMVYLEFTHVAADRLIKLCVSAVSRPLEQTGN